MCSWRESRALLLNSLKGDYKLSVEEKTRLGNSIRHLVLSKSLAHILAQHYTDELLPEAMTYLAGKVRGWCPRWELLRSY